MPNLYVKVIKTREIVHTVPLKSTNWRYIEKVMLGMLRNMDTDNYFIDDNEKEVKMDIGIVCDQCGSELSALMRLDTIQVTPCDKCITKAVEEGYDKVYEEGSAEGSRE